MHFALRSRDGQRALRIGGGFDHHVAVQKQQRTLRMGVIDIHHTIGVEPNARTVTQCELRDLSVGL
ncbi:hypothetical protein M5G07_11080 [Serratia symbiotica]|nr:hypothetical protein [Serratia symbiotica]